MIADYNKRKRTIEVDQVVKSVNHLLKYRNVLNPFVSEEDLVAAGYSLSPDLLQKYRVEDFITRQRNKWKVLPYEGLEDSVPLVEAQRCGVNYLLKMQRCILADDMGMGKSAQLIVTGDLFPDPKLVITNKALIKNFKAEINKWATRPELFTVVNYESLHKVDNPKQYQIIICDEVEKLLNRKTKVFREVKKITRYTKYVWLSGATYIRNSADEIWSLLHILYPLHFTSYWDFVNYFFDTEYNFASDQTDIVGLRDSEKFYKFIEQYILSRDVEQEALPELKVETVYLDMPKEQALVYKQLESKWFTQSVSVSSMLTLFIRLRQILLDPTIVGIPMFAHAVKTQWILDYCKANEDKKILVFTNFAEYAKLLYNVIPHSCLHIGELEHKVRHHVIEEYKCTELKTHVLIGTTKSMAAGLNLQCTDVIIFADENWSHEDTQQAIARAYRRGRTNPVQVYSLQVQGTIDDYMRTVRESKEEIIDVADAMLKIRKEYGILNGA